MKFYLYLVFTITIAGCSSTGSSPTNDTEFVDVHAFFESEVSKLTAEKTGVYKRTRMDELSKSDSTKTPDWSHELYAFLDLSIKPAVWTTDFIKTDIDAHDDPNESALVYTSTNSKQKIKLFKLKLDDSGQIVRFSAELVDEGKISSTVTGLSYTKNVGYSIAVERNTRIMGNESYQIVGQFFKNK